MHILYAVFVWFLALVFLFDESAIAQESSLPEMLTTKAGKQQTRPRLGGPLRYDEDWSLLSNPANQKGAWYEPYKYVPFSGSEQSYLTFGNELRFRYELLENPNWGEEDTDKGGYYWFRALPTVDLHLGERFRVFGELIAAPSAGVDPEPSGLDDNVADVLQAFGELKLTQNTSFQMGRKVLSVGSERLIGTRYGVNVLQAFDVVQLSHGDAKRSIYAIYGRPVDVEVGSFNDDWSRTIQGWTVYWSRDLVDAGFASRSEQTLDLYYIGFENTEAIFDQGSGLERRQTLAGRWHGGRDRWNWDHELFVQFGRFAQTDIQAWSLATLARYASNLPLSPEFTLQFNIISGDQDRNDGVLGTFNPLFPRLKYFGESGVIAPANLFDLHPGISFQVSERVALKADAQFLWRYSKDDGVYGPGGQLLRTGTDSDSRYVATQYEIGTEVEFNENLTCNFFYATLPPGAFIRESGVSKTIHFVGAETTWSY